MFFFFNISHSQCVTIGLDGIRRLILLISRRQDNKKFLEKCAKFIKNIQRNHDNSGLSVNATKPTVFDQYNVSHHTKVLGPSDCACECEASVLITLFYETKLWTM